VAKSNQVSLKPGFARNDSGDRRVCSDGLCRVELPFDSEPRFRVCPLCYSLRERSRHVIQGTLLGVEHLLVLLARFLQQGVEVCAEINLRSYGPRQKLPQRAVLSL
jgi:hypothetical protein